MKKIALISAILESPQENQQQFNDIVAAHRLLVRGRMGLPFEEADIAVIAITAVGEMDEINSLVGKLGSIPNVTVKTAVSKKNMPELRSKQ